MVSCCWFWRKGKGKEMMGLRRLQSLKGLPSHLLPLRSAQHHYFNTTSYPKLSTTTTTTTTHGDGDGDGNGMFPCRTIFTWNNAHANSSISATQFHTSNQHHSIKDNHLSFLLKFSRSMSTQGKLASRQMRQGALKVTMLSPGFIFEPYQPRERIPFWRRWFTLSGWRRTKEDVILEMKNAYAIARLRKKFGYSKKLFYQEALNLYKEVNILLANGDKALLRKVVTENMFSTLKNDLKRRESIWSSVYWELIEPAVGIRTLRARLIGIDKNDLDKSFIQLTVEFLTKQKFEAYDLNGDVVTGDQTKEVLVRDVWVFEKSLFHPGSYWRVCARLSL